MFVSFFLSFFFYFVCFFCWFFFFVGSFVFCWFVGWFVCCLSVCYIFHVLVVLTVEVGSSDLVLWLDVFHARLIDSMLCCYTSYCPMIS